MVSLVEMLQHTATVCTVMYTEYVWKKQQQQQKKHSLSNRERCHWLKLDFIFGPIIFFFHYAKKKKSQPLFEGIFDTLLQTK